MVIVPRESLMPEARWKASAQRLSMSKRASRNTFSGINIGLHQGLALSPYPFALVMDEVIRCIQDGIPGCMLFADDVVSVDERTGVDQKLELWRQALERRF
jgi:hypothetical protein